MGIDPEGGTKPLDGLDSPTFELARWLSRLRWQIPALLFLVALLGLLAQLAWLGDLAPATGLVGQVLLLSLGSATLLWWAVGRLGRRLVAVETEQQSLRMGSAETHQRLEFLGRVNERLVRAVDEETLIEVGLDLMREAVPARGCSLLRFDERGHPLPAVHYGDLDLAFLEAWSAHLMRGGEQHPCTKCSGPRLSGAISCPRAVLATTAAAIGQVHCLVIGRGAQEYGVLNLYLEDTAPLGRQDQILLQAIADGLALALESQHLRSRELSMFHHLRQARQRSTFQQELAQVLAHTVGALDVAGGALFVSDPETRELDMLAQAGDPSPLSLVRGLVRGTQGLTAPLIIGDLEQTDSAAGEVCSLLVVPLNGSDSALGSLVLWTALSGAFGQRHMQLTTTLADQLALLVENHRLYLQAEHQVVLAERARLAREIHDGLAQTLGYLKLRAAQIGRWLERGEIDRGNAALSEMGTVLAEAYVDVREAIDGLNLKPSQGQMKPWLEQILADFQRFSGISVEATLPADLAQPPEVEVQLMRIVQEALNNVRKHSAASRVWLSAVTDRRELTLRIVDNGQGFDAIDVPPISQHGLRIMRERAELLDADFQIISRSGAGTEIVVRLPSPAPYVEETHA